jgi:hypothetical protein
MDVIPTIADVKVHRSLAIPAEIFERTLWLAKATDIFEVDLYSEVIGEARILANRIRINLVLGQNKHAKHEELYRIDVAYLSWINDIFRPNLQINLFLNPPRVFILKYKSLES